LSGTHKSTDLITLGRSSVDLYGDQIGGRLEDVASFAKYVGGSPTNTAVAAARLGLRAGLITRVGADHMGRFIKEQLIRENVDVRAIRSDARRLTALVVLGIRDRQTFPLIFYRENCADMALCEQDLDPEYLASTQALLINGTHLSTPTVFAASASAARQVKAQGGRVIFDIDYRPVLWGLTPKDLGENRFVNEPLVTERLRQVLPLCDLIVGTEEEMCILGGSEAVLEALKKTRESTAATLVCKRGEHGCVAFEGEIPGDWNSGLTVPGFKVQVLNVLGAGDAFMGGLLRGWLKGLSLEESCRMGNACGALVVSRHGCAPAMPSWQELQLFLSSNEPQAAQFTQAHLEHVHWAATRRHRYAELTVLALDHRMQFEALAESSVEGRERIAIFNTLGLRALDAVARGREHYGILLDGRYGFEALSQGADLPYWIGRPIEISQSRPLEFEASADVATELATWPVPQVVKCVVIYHPDDELELREKQERQLLRLFDACRKTRHELLLEVMVPKEMPTDDETVARAISRIYSLGIRPDWWKLAPSAHAAAWRAIQDSIVGQDALCRGVLLGLSASQSDLIASFRAAAPFSIVKGFAIGRTLFDEVARQWFAGAMNDQTAAAGMAQRFSLLVAAWRGARAGAIS
jgi:5-dehydro-2-deoxygluconokinase